MPRVPGRLDGNNGGVATTMHQRATAVPAKPADDDAVERPLWQIVALLYAAIALLAVLLIGVSFLAAYLVTGRAY